MTLRSYLWGMRLAFVASLAVLILVIKQIDPDVSGIIGQVLFFAAAFFFLASLFILFFTWLRKKISSDEESVVVHLGISFRQGVLLALLVTILLLAQRFRVLIWWDGALAVAGILLAELYFLTRK